jgi:hypothetical protein
MNNPTTLKRYWDAVANFGPSVATVNYGSGYKCKSSTDGKINKDIFLKEMEKNYKVEGKKKITVVDHPESGFATFHLK